MRQHANAKLRTQANRILAAPDTEERDQVYQRLLAAFDLPGNPVRGRSLFQEKCASCHRFGGQGYALGPDLASVRNSGPEKWLMNLIDPNRESLPQYLAYLVEKRDGTSYMGIITEETDRHLRLSLPFGIEQIIPRSQVKTLRSLNQSLMPGGLEVGLSHQDIADLWAYTMDPEYARE